MSLYENERFGTLNIGVLVDERKCKEKRMNSITSRKVNFTLKTAPGKAVFIAGTFNNWSPDTNRLRERFQTGEYAISLRLPHGQHEYKFVVDGVWENDPDNPDCVMNGLGTLNNIIDV